VTLDTLRRKDREYKEDESAAKLNLVLFVGFVG